jgi:transposase
MREVMLKQEVATDMKDLYRQGLSISEISKITGYNRRTVRKYAKTSVPPTSKKRKRKSSKLDNYKDYIISRLNAHPLTASRIYREIKDEGFTGKYTIVKDFVRSVRPKIGVPAVYRYETKPGKQSQVDWGECGKIEIDGKIRKLYCFAMVLGYSRMRYVEFTLSIDAPTFIQCHLNAFDFFGGYTEEILYDNIKQIIIKRAIKSTESEWNSQFEQFFRHFGFTPRLCRPYRPQTKGKIESTIGFVKRDFFMGGNFSSLSDLDSQLVSWLKRVNSNVHGTTQEIPEARLMAENLNMIGECPTFIVCREVMRKISRDCFISYEGNKYSVPYQFAGCDAKLQIENNRFEVLVGSKVICEYEIQSGSGRTCRIKEHFSGLLSEVLKENCSRMQKQGDILRFPDLAVNTRPLSVYDELIGGLENE